MKTLKIAFLSMIVVLLTFTSCTNNEPVIEDQNITESASITTALGELASRMNSDGDIISFDNPSGKHCF